MGHVGRVLIFVTIVLSSTVSMSSLRAALVTSLGVLGDDTHSSAVDINDAGVVVGASFHFPPTVFQPPPVFQGFRWTAAGGMQPIGWAGGAQSVVNAVNEAGVSAGWANESGQFVERGFVHAPPAAMQTVPGAGPATGINDNGVIVGNGVAFGVGHAYLYTGSGTPQDLGVIGGQFSNANDINNAGVVVGWTNINTTALKRAARHVNGAWSAIPGLSNFTDSEARAINEAGDIVGMVGSSGAFRFNSATGTTTLLTSPFGISRQAWDINDAGFVVGSVDGRAALWRPDGSFVDLEAWLDVTSPAEGLSVTLRQANAINNQGFIVGNAGSGGGQGAFLLDARSLVPEPAAISLILPAAAALLRRRRR